MLLAFRIVKDSGLFSNTLQPLYSPTLAGHGDKSVRMLHVACNSNPLRNVPISNWLSKGSTHTHTGYRPMHHGPIHANHVRCMCLRPPNTLSKYWAVPHNNFKSQHNMNWAATAWQLSVHLTAALLPGHAFNATPCLLEPVGRSGQKEWQ
jgi:hypothetical protein